MFVDYIIFVHTPMIEILDLPLLVVEVVGARTACSIGDGVGGVGTTFAADGVFVVVVGLCGDLTWTCTKYQMLCKKR